MNKVDLEKMKKLSGEQYYRRPQSGNYTRIKFNGNEGKFYTVERVDDEYNESLLGKEYEGTMIRVRRQLMDFGNELYSSEHNHPGEEIMLFGANERGEARKLREKYEGLRTHQIVYVLNDDGEVDKLTVKGASLGSNNKPEESVPFYDYLNSFGSDEHVWQYKTKMEPIKEKSQLGNYYAMSFERGKKLNEDQLKEVADRMEELQNMFDAQQEYYESTKETDDTVQEDADPDFDEDAEEELPEIDIEDLGGDEIDPEEVM